jgi:hypothetical protein
MGTTLTEFFYIRQKDGPYFVDLGGNWYTRFDSLRLVRGAVPRFSWKEAGLFESNLGLDSHLVEAIERVCSDTQSLSDAELKTKVYLTKPMRHLLAQERLGRSTLNHPLLV